MPEGRRIWTSSTSGEFMAWNGLTFNFETILQAYDNYALIFIHASTYIACANQSGIVMYIPNTNNPTTWPGHREAVLVLSFSQDDGRLATASNDPVVRVWSFAMSRKERTLTGHGWDVKYIECHLTMGLLVPRGKRNPFQFWNPLTGTALTSLYLSHLVVQGKHVDTMSPRHQHKITMQAFVWVPYGTLLPSASWDQMVRVSDICSMKEWVVLTGHKKEVCCTSRLPLSDPRPDTSLTPCYRIALAWHPVRPIPVSGGPEGAIVHWDLTPTDLSSWPPSCQHRPHKSPLRDA